METAIWSLLSLAVGAVITFLVSRHYAKKGSIELIREADGLRHVSFFLLRSMAKAGWIERLLNEENRTKGYRIRDEFGGEAIYLPGVFGDSRNIVGSGHTFGSSPYGFETFTLEERERERRQQHRIEDENS